MSLDAEGKHAGVQFSKGMGELLSSSTGAGSELRAEFHTPSSDPLKTAT